ncbi:MAG: LamG-like jellyroll fold domain-containing protein, partial [Pirellulales bacterium]
GRDWRGLIDEPAIFSTALTDAQIAGLYNAANSSAADGIQVSINGTTVVTSVGADLVTGVAADVYTSAAGNVNSLNELENDAFNKTNDAVQNIRGLEIDLSDFGVPFGGSVNSMQVGSAVAGNPLDPVFVAGLPKQLSPTLASGITLDYDAGDKVNTHTRWDRGNPDINANFDWNLVNVSRDATPPTNLPGIGASYVFNSSNPGGGNEFVNSSSGSFDAFNNLPAGPDNESASWEFWLRPDSVAANSGNDFVIWETGGSGDGASLAILDGDELRFTAKDSGANLITKADISGLGGEFFQVVVSYDKNTGGQDSLRMYINGNPTPVDTAVAAANNVNDWDGGDDASIGRRGSTTGGHTASGSLNFNVPYKGQIAIFRFYSDGTTSNGTVLTGVDAANNYLAITNPNPPVIGNLDGDLTPSVPPYIPGSRPVVLDIGQNATVTDADNPANFGTGSLTVRIISGAEVNDFVGLPNSATNGELGGEVFIGGVKIGDVTSAGIGGANLVVAFTSNATLPRIEQLLRLVNFQVIGVNAINPSRSFEFILEDGQFGTATVTTNTVIKAGDGIPNPFVWDNDNGDFDWNNPANWDVGGSDPPAKPDADDIGIFDGSGAGTVLLNGRQFIGGVRFDAGGYTIDGGSVELDLVDQNVGENEIAGVLKGVATSLNVDGGTLTVSNTTNQFAVTSSVNINAGAKLLASIDGNDFSLSDTDIVLNSGDLEIVGPGYRDKVLALSDLEAYWEFNDGAGSTTVADSSPNGRSGNIVSGAGLSPGIIGDALTLDGNGDYVQLNASAYKGVTGTAARTMVAWIKKNTTGAN